LLYTRSQNKILFVDCSDIENSGVKRDRLFLLKYNEEKCREVLDKINSMIKKGKKISDEEFKLFSGMVLN
jgi:hypothetical protein